jgi:hypothetical protein
MRAPAGRRRFQEHWGQNGFARTDLDLQLKQRRIERII